MKRPPFDSSVTRINATVSKSLKDQLARNPLVKMVDTVDDGQQEKQGTVKEGESCKNSGCKAVR